METEIPRDDDIADFIPAAFVRSLLSAFHYALEWAPEIKPLAVRRCHYISFNLKSIAPSELRSAASRVRPTASVSFLLNGKVFRFFSNTLSPATFRNSR